MYIFITSHTFLSNDGEKKVCFMTRSKNNYMIIILMNLPIFCTTPNTNPKTKLALG